MLTLAPSRFGQRLTAALERLALIISAVAAVGFVVTLLQNCSLGYDFSDEGYYLNWISGPSDFTPSISRFGYVYHPLYLMLDGNISSLRRANVLITFLLAVAACMCLLRRLAMETEGFSFWRSADGIGLSIVAACSATLILILASSQWLPTPSYLSLTFQALLICCIGVGLAESSASLASIAGWIAIGIAGFLAFSAKPTSGVALPIFVTGLLAVTGRLKWRMLMIAAGVSGLAMLIQIFTIDGSIGAFIRHMRNGAELADELAVGHTLVESMRVGTFHLDLKEKIALAATTATVLLLVWLNYLEGCAANLIAATATAALAVLSAALVWQIISFPFDYRIYQGVQFLALLFAGVLGCVALQIGGSTLRLTRERAALAVFFAVLPYAFAFGSNLNYWRTGAAAAFFWTLAAIALLAPAKLVPGQGRSLLPVAVVAFVMAVVFMRHGMTHPYRQTAPLSESTSAAHFGGSGSTLLLTQDFAAYIGTLRSMAGIGGFRVRDPVIDLTGHYPGALFAIGAKPVGEAWLVGGYSGSDHVGERILESVSCVTLATAWILSEPAGLRHLSPDILDRSGIDIARDYETVGTLESPTGTYPDTYKQQFLRPNRAPLDAVAACKVARAATQQKAQ
ncbi:hypothetical protein [Nitrobacter vulgaris]|uniref:Glycosyltransferase RgtA/B/C/D-like domain-containing protein n=1 Tax=Nitrobacter vulgaris TaxID=29421 RepID=A0A1V4HVS5_NITVU|nr:hypothetical protein [Nitrobacter vulgaris]OPH82081.1 hypothetical protein B2M20_12865 [Nitrobacter vulgaris]